VPRDLSCGNGARWTTLTEKKNLDSRRRGQIHRVSCAGAPPPAGLEIYRASHEGKAPARLHEGTSFILTALWPTLMTDAEAGRPSIATSVAVRNFRVAIIQANWAGLPRTVRSRFDDRDIDRLGVAAGGDEGDFCRAATGNREPARPSRPSA